MPILRPEDCQSSLYERCKECNQYPALKGRRHHLCLFCNGGSLRPDLCQVINETGPRTGYQCAIEKEACESKCPSHLVGEGLHSSIDVTLSDGEESEDDDDESYENDDDSSFICSSEDEDFDDGSEEDTSEESSVSSSVTSEDEVSVSHSEEEDDVTDEGEEINVSHSKEEEIDNPTPDTGTLTFTNTSRNQKRFFIVDDEEDSIDQVEINVYKKMKTHELIACMRQITDELSLRDFS